MTTTVHFATAGDNSMPTTSENANLYHTDFLGCDGVNGQIINPASGADTGSMAVVAQSTPDMTVAVSAGQAYVTVTPTGEASRRVRVNLSSSTNVTIAANSTGSTKYDLVYIKLPAATLADPPASGNWTENTVYLTERMDSSGQTLTDTTNTLLLAEVTVVDSETAIANDEITDKRWETVPLGSVAARHGITAVDFTYTTEQSSYVDIDLSSIIPEGARTGCFHMSINDDTNGSYFVLKTKDYDWPIFKNVYNNSEEHLYCEIPLDSNRTIQYKLIDDGGTSVTGARITVLGWRF